ncbi:hypothetical protein AF335_17845 [Streptomyces eurocidicus]|uniref:Uncharacterized protein n=1 Tax=Streptomyces eurocidicus TaxID=66423 RepID=A0A2N8NUK9_STREU|nr:hypothetical protein AF335_17845 [Streptomyces eurocidicus]
MSEDTRAKLLEGAPRTLTEQGIAKTSARSVAAAASVNQSLVFYHLSYGPACDDGRGGVRACPTGRLADETDGSDGPSPRDRAYERVNHRWSGWKWQSHRTSGVPLAVLPLFASPTHLFWPAADTRAAVPSPRSCIRHH